jgi:hypothetical protein
MSFNYSAISSDFLNINYLGSNVLFISYFTFYLTGTLSPDKARGSVSLVPNIL